MWARVNRRPPTPLRPGHPPYPSGSPHYSPSPPPTWNLQAPRQGPRERGEPTVTYKGPPHRTPWWGPGKSSRGTQGRPQDPGTVRAQEWEGRVRARWSPASSALSACCVLPQEGGPTRDRVLILCAASGGWADAGPGSDLVCCLRRVGRRGTGFCGRQGPSAVARAGPRRAPHLSPLVASSAM